MSEYVPLIFLVVGILIMLGGIRLSNTIEHGAEGMLLLIMGMLGVFIGIMGLIQ